MAALFRLLRSVPVSSVACRRVIPALSYSGQNSMPTDEEQATGLEKKEHDALVAGVEDPFNLSMKVRKVPGGTKEKPQLVPSMYSERMVGCICDEDSVAISWMALKKGPAQRCECGYWYQLVEGNPIQVEV